MAARYLILQSLLFVLHGYNINVFQSTCLVAKATNSTLSKTKGLFDIFKRFDIIFSSFCKLVYFVQ